YLTERGVGEGSIVGICLEHSPAAVVALIAVLKTGAAYVPLDPAHPRAKLTQMILDAQMSVIISQQKLADSLSADPATVISIDSDWEDIAASCKENLAAVASAESIAYVIYTSGSTGVPKGV